MLQVNGLVYQDAQRLVRDYTGNREELSTREQNLGLRVRHVLSLYDLGQASSEELEETVQEANNLLREWKDEDGGAQPIGSVVDRVFQFIQELNAIHAHPQMAQQLLHEVKRYNVGLLDAYGLQQLLERARVHYSDGLENAH